MYESDDSNRRQKPIRIGIICKGTIFPAWQASCLNKLLNVNNTELALLIIEDDYSTNPKNHGKSMKSQKFRKLFWHIYKSFIVRFTSQALHLENMTINLSKIPFISCKIIPDGESFRYFCKEDIVKIKNYNLDFILSFGSKIICGEILKIPRFGVWSFNHGDIKKYSGHPPGFWEIYNDDNVTGAVLQRLTGQLNNGIILKKGFFKTINTSYVHNIDTVYFESAWWPAQVCIDIINGNENYIYDLPTKKSIKIYDYPTNMQMILFLIKIIKNFFMNWIHILFFYYRWNIGIINEPINVFLTPDIRPKVSWLPEPKENHFVSDPFVISKENVNFILFEEYDLETSKGHISSTIIDDKSLFQSIIVIDNPFHMSYPFLLKDKDQIYCVPETSRNKQVCLYKAKEFPYSWIKISTLIQDFAGLDSTIFKYENHWWLFATDKNDGSNYKLKLWYAPNLFGPWTPHINNPVKIDIRSTRPAGTPFIYDNVLYRPSQDCSEKYGAKIVINKIIKLTTTEFKEEQIIKIEPYKNSPYPDILHTISSDNGITIVDGGKKIFVGKNAYMTVYKMKRIIQNLKTLISKNSI
jgi:hypothetical protein